MAASAVLPIKNPRIKEVGVGQNSYVRKKQKIEVCGLVAGSKPQENGAATHARRASVDAIDTCKLQLSTNQDETRLQWTAVCCHGTASGGYHFILSA